MRRFRFILPLAALAASLSCGRTEDARTLHERLFTLDSHVDTPMRATRTPVDLSVRHGRSDPGGGDLDFPRMAEGGLDAAFFAVYVAQSERTGEGRERARGAAEALIDSVRAWGVRYSGWMGIALSPREAERIAASGKRAVCLGMENGFPLGTDPSLVAHFFERGVRYVTLCHSRNNDLCDSSTDPDGPEWGGLSPAGEAAVRAMNRAGMLVDVSHASDSAFADVLRLSRSPVIASHSCCRALMDHPRNLTDGMLRALARNGGVAQINLCSFYLVETEPDPKRRAALDSVRAVYGDWRRISDPARQKAHGLARAEIDRLYPENRASVVDFADHVDHAVRIAGIDHVGIGSDFDGGAGLSDVPDVSRMGRITEELLRRGYSGRDLAKIWGGNFMRAWRTALKRSER
jgi:membrane dipeptidase